MVTQLPFGDSAGYSVKVKFLDPIRGMAYVEAGSGETLVFVHGSLCDWRYWLPQLRGLNDGARVVAPSLRHYHPRLPSSLGQPFSWTTHVDQLAIFLAKLRAPRLHLIGHSRGAAVAYQLALRNPGLLTSLTLVDPGGPLEGERETEDPATTAVRRQAVALIEAGEIDEGLKLFVDSVSRAGFWDRSHKFFQDMARDNAVTLGPQLDDPLPIYRRAEAESIACPTLLVRGGRSPETYRLNAERLNTWIPRAQLLTLEEASHGMTLTHAQRFNRELSGFLAGL